MSLFSRILSNAKIIVSKVKEKSLELQNKNKVNAPEPKVGSVVNVTPTNTPVKPLSNKDIILLEAKKQNITNKNEIAMLLAQLDHESLGFTRLEESFNYRPDRLLAVFTRYIRNLNDSKQLLAQGPQAVANRVYGGRMGNTAPNDGWKYRGRGFIQLTGKNNYVAQEKLTGFPLVSNPDLLLDPVKAAQVSISYWKNTNGLRSSAQNGNVTRVSAIINTGNANTSPSKINGLQDRLNKFTKYIKEV